MRLKENAKLTHSCYSQHWSEQMRYEPFSPEVLKALRAEKGITQKELSENSGIPLITIKKIESGVYKPSIETLMALGKYFNLYLYADWKSESPQLES